MNKVLLIDLGSVYWEAWHSSAQDAVSAAHDRAVTRVRRARDGFKLVAVCCDSPKSFRREKDPEYKKNRPEKDLAAIEQLRRTRATLEADGLLCWEAEGFEADDVIATATKHALAGGLEVSILSSDKDLLQLVSEQVTVTSLKTDITYRVVEVQSRYGVAPSQMRDWLALVGDKSDNVKGVPGIGDKRAAELLGRFGSVGALLAAMDRDEDVATPAITESLNEHRDTLLTAIQLVTLRTDAPIVFEQIFEERQARPLVDAEWQEDEPAAEAAPRPRPVQAPTALANVEPPADDWALALEPTSTSSAFTMAKHLFNSRLYSNFPSAEAVFAVILRGRSLGLDATTALANFHVVEGKPSMSATLIVGLVVNSGKAEYFDLVETTDEQATWTTRRKGSTREVTMTFSVRDALNAGLLVGTPDDARGVSKSGKPSNWDKYRRAMLRHRSAVELARAVYADVVSGLYTPDEVSEGRTIEASFEG